MSYLRTLSLTQSFHLCFLLKVLQYLLVFIIQFRLIFNIRYKYRYRLKFFFFFLNMVIWLFLVPFVEDKTIHWTDIVFLKKKINHICVNPFLSSILFHWSLCLSSVSTTLFWSLKIWNQVVSICIFWTLFWLL